MSALLLDAAIAQIGKLHDGPDVVRLAREISERFPKLAAYCNEAKSDTPWCGIFIAWLLATKLGIEPPAGFMYVDNYATNTWGATLIKSGQEQPGDIICLRSPHHVTILKEVRGDRYVCIGGNQSDAVTESSYARSGLMAVIRPPALAGGVVVAPDPHPEIKLGATGAPVLELQRLLGMAEQDGEFGNDTDAAVRAFQAAHGLDVDGEVGPDSWKALLGNPQQLPPLPMNTQTSKGSWYSQYDGKYHWHDGADGPNSAALGVPDDAQGIARPTRETLGDWYMVRAPNGKVSIEQQTDRGPGASTGRTIDISAAAAERFGYSPQNFPTDSIFTFWPVDPPREVAGLSKQQQAVRYRDIRKGKPMPDPVDPPKPLPVPPVPPVVPLPVLPLPQIDILQGLHYIVSGNREKVREDLKLFLDVFNSKHADIPISLPPAPTTPAPTGTPLHQTPAFQLGGIGVVLTAILHQIGVLDPNMAILSAIVSAGAAFLGPAGGIVGTIVMNLAKAAWTQAQNQPTPPTK